MDQAPEMVTVYRSMDETAKQDCETIMQELADEGLSPVMLDDTAPGVPEGVYAVQVPAGEAERASGIRRAHPLPDEVEDVDNSSNLDLETLYHSEGSIGGEMEAMGIKNVLESNGIAAVLIGDSVLPNFPFEVRVARDQVQRAQQLLAEALRGGEAAAEEGERQSERGAPAE